MTKFAWLNAFRNSAWKAILAFSGSVTRDEAPQRDIRCERRRLGQELCGVLNNALYVREIQCEAVKVMDPGPPQRVLAGLGSIAVTDAEGDPRRFGVLALNNEDFVTRVYSNVLSRAPDGAGAAYWRQQLNAGMSRGQMLLEFSEGAEYRSIVYSDVVVTMLSV